MTTAGDRKSVIVSDSAIPEGSRGDRPCSALVLLGAGPPVRGTQPSALAQAGPRGRVLDWLLAAFRLLGIDKAFFVGGYKLSEVVVQYPLINFVLNPSWETDGPLGSLLSAPINADSTVFVSYTDIVYEHDAVQRLNDDEADAVLLVDALWRKRFAGRPLVDVARAEKVLSQGDAVAAVGTDLPLTGTGEFAGLVKLGPRAVNRLLDLQQHGGPGWRRRGLPAFLQLLVEEGFVVHTEETNGRWAELNAPQDLARFVLGTKAGTLARLQPLIRKSIILDHYVFTVGDWRTDPEHVLDLIAKSFDPNDVIVRSSTASEDSWTSSNAGAFVSVDAVSPGDRAAVADAVERVVDSYVSGDSSDEILVQACLRDVVAAGVMMTRSPKTGAPYLIINYDDTSGRTDSVTGGTAERTRTIYVHLPSADRGRLTTVAQRLHVAAVELQSLVGHDSLDVEFAILPDGVIAVLQVRPIVADYGDWRVPDQDVELALADAERQFDRLQEPGPFLVGGGIVLGVMPDWNPAEILGVKPRPLALSLYQALITDEVWAQQRAEFGYRDVRPCPLVVTVAGQPFVDVRASLNSFVPSVMDDDTAGRMVDHYLNRLCKFPELHDKLEFEVALTCMPFDFDQQVDTRLQGVFNVSQRDQLARALAELTRRGLDGVTLHTGRVMELENRAERILLTVADPIDRAYLLLEDCRRLGTLAFSHLARLGFIAFEWLRSLVRIGVLEQADVDNFLNSLNTVTRDFMDDAARVADNQLAWDEFVYRYGHLRPGTYDVTSQCYADMLGQYLAGASITAARAASCHRSQWRWPQRIRRNVESQLSRIGIPMGLDDFDSFLRRAIEGREYAKFAFTKNLSMALEDFARIGHSLNLGREELSYLQVNDLLALRRGGSANTEDVLRDKAVAGTASYQRTLAVELPALVTRREELRAFEQFEVVPNFVTTQKVRGKVARVECAVPSELEEAIVLIPSADPGYDWLFLRSIRGLVTAYGGVNSHMAIRAAEQGLPAAIGVGPKRYRALREARAVEIDCASRTLRVVV
jgi:choline kinase/phosphohistidine swiveling domain-containing protein